MNVAENNKEQIFDLTNNFTISGSDSSVNTKEIEQAQKRKDCYFEIIAEFHKICIDLRKNSPASAKTLQLKINEFIKLYKEDERMFLSLANVHYSYIYKNLTKKVYGIVVIHGLNTMIYSLKISIALGVPEARLPYICFAALFRCINLLSLQEDKLILAVLNNDIIKEISSPNSNATNYLKQIKFESFDFKFLNALCECLMRINSNSLGDSENEMIIQYSYIIYLCDEFEKLTHLHVYGKKLSPVDAMKTLRDEMVEHFNVDIIKVFFNNLSIYPVGTYVKLSSGEIAKIVELNNNSLLRPLVMIVTEENGNIKQKPIRLNLREKPNLYIRKPVVDEDLTETYIDLI
jgi:hypothetical protein